MSGSFSFPGPGKAQPRAGPEPATESPVILLPTCHPCAANVSVNPPAPAPAGRPAPRPPAPGPSPEASGLRAFSASPVRHSRISGRLPALLSVGAKCRTRTADLPFSRAFLCPLTSCFGACPQRPAQTDSCELSVRAWTSSRGHARGRPYLPAAELLLSAVGRGGVTPARRVSVTPACSDTLRRAPGPGHALLRARMQCPVDRALAWPSSEMSTL